MWSALSRGLLCQGQAMTPPEPIKVIALTTLLTGVALMLAALLF
jgi:hypothetical protein